MNGLYLWKDILWNSYFLNYVFLLYCNGISNLFIIFKANRTEIHFPTAEKYIKKLHKFNCIIQLRIYKFLRCTNNTNAP